MVRVIMALYYFDKQSLEYKHIPLLRMFIWFIFLLLFSLSARFLYFEAKIFSIETYNLKGQKVIQRITPQEKAQHERQQRQYKIEEQQFLKRQ